jgi:hypothetical protein
MSRVRRAVFGIALVALFAGVSAVPPAGAAFGLKNLDQTFTNFDGSPAMQAGSHPPLTTVRLDVNTEPGPESVEIPSGALKNLTIEMPPGLVGDPSAVPTCSSATFYESVNVTGKPCPNDTVVGFTELEIGGGAEPPQPILSPVYNLEPILGEPLRLGLIALVVPIAIDFKLKQSAPYNAIGSITNASQVEKFYGSKTVIWGNPADPAHDDQRGTCLKVEEGLCPVNIPERPFLLMPRSCQGPLTTGFEATSWQDPDAAVRYEIESHDSSVPPNPLGVTGCSKLGFAASIEAKPTTDRAESPSGLDFNLDIEDQGITSAQGHAQSDIKKAVVTLPRGVTVNPSVAEGLVACTPADLDDEDLEAEPGEGCPEASKVGTVEVETPLLEGKLLKGLIYVAEQDDPATPEPGAENPFDSLIAIYMVIKNPELGILVKLPGRVEPDPQTGQLVTTFGEPGYEIPQFPFSHFRFHFREGGRAPLVTPPACGDFRAEAVFTPWASPNASVPIEVPTFHIGLGAGGGPCPPGGVPPFKPGFEAGSISNNAGSYSPFYMRLTRADGDQDMTRFDSVLPPGVTGKIAGLSKCPEAAIAAAEGKTGRQELAQPSCPASSEIGRTLAGAGVGSALTYVPGKIYLGGPFAGDPLSILAITPAVAGPFDAGVVVVREALTLNPTTAQVEVDGAHSDPIPHILKGIPLKLRDLRVYVDRPNFTLNPTSCEPMAAGATLFGSNLDLFSSADDVPAALSSRYQAANCAALKFKPKLSLRLKGGTKRGAHPALRSVVTYPKGAGYANVAKAVVTLPHSAFLEQAHIRTVCTRVQFAAHSCPAGSIYGQARAVTPLLDEPVEGPVYLRSSSHPLPDLVFALRGIVEVDVVARLDSTHARIRASLESVPDVPVSKFVLDMQGGKKGLIVNSRDLCAHPARATASLTAQSGKVYDQRPVVKADCGKGARHARVSHRSG